MSKRIKATFSEGAFQTDEQFVEGQDYWLKVSPAPKKIYSEIQGGRDCDVTGPITGGESSEVDGSFSTIIGGHGSDVTEGDK